MNNFKFKEKKKLVLITAIYFFSQFFLLIATGSWWDDWLQISKNWEWTYDAMRGSSLPLAAYIDRLLWELPGGGYRYLVFINYYISAILIYGILRKIDIFSSKDVFWITILYIVMPINDARITFVCCIYSIGLLFFWIAFYVTTLWVNEKNRVKKILLRLLTLAILLFSYNTESIMFMTLLILVYIIYENNKQEWSYYNTKEKCKRIIVYAIRHIDFLILPILFYFGKHIIFPGYEPQSMFPGFYSNMYAKHNYIDWVAVPKLILLVPVYIFVNLGAEFLYNFYLLLAKRNVFIVIFFILLTIFAIFCYSIVYTRKKESFIFEDQQKKETSTKLIVKMLLFSLFVFFVGMFPYYIRNHGYVATREYDGRHSLLFGLGSAMFVYYIVQLIPIKKIKNIIYICVICFGIVFFNVKYLEWQEDYYQSLRFETGIKNITTDDKITVYYLGVKNKGINIENYRFNGNAWEAEGNFNKQFLIENIDAFELDNFGGVIIFSNEKMSYCSVIQQKINELFNKEEFNEFLSTTSGVKYIPASDSRLNELYSKYINNDINKDQFQSELLEL